MTTFSLGRKTIINEYSLEYDWVRRQVEEGTETERIVSSIQHCFGGDKKAANLFLAIAVGESVPGALLNHLALSDWSLTQNQYAESLDR